MIPWCFGTSGSVRASSRPNDARSPRLVHTFCPRTDHASPSRHRARRQARQVGAGARLGEQLAPDLLVASDRAQEALLLLVGAPLHDRGPGEIDADRIVEARHLVAAQRARDRARRRSAATPRPPYSVGHVGVT